MRILMGMCGHTCLMWGKRYCDRETTELFVFFCFHSGNNRLTFIWYLLGWREWNAQSSLNTTTLECVRVSWLKAVHTRTQGCWGRAWQADLAYLWVRELPGRTRGSIPGRSLVCIGNGSGTWAILADGKRSAWCGCVLQGKKDSARGPRPISIGEWGRQSSGVAPSRDVFHQRQGA